MAHLRKRYLQDTLEEVMRFSPLIGILGHRQVGKTTTLENVSSHYFTLDDQATRKKVYEDAKGFLQENHILRTAIDESQFEPELFYALKERVRKDKRPGQYILSGSVRFTSRRAIRESLTGRIVNFELLPFSISEIRHKENPNTIKQLLGANRLEQLEPILKRENTARKELDKEIDLYFEHGGLPGICFVRNKKMRETRIQEQLATLLDRHLRMIYPSVSSYGQILEFVSALSQFEGQKIVHTKLKEISGLVPATQKRILYALEGIFLIRLLPIRGNEKGYAVFFEDQAEAIFLDRTKSLQTQLEGLLYRNLRVQLNYDLSNHHQFFIYSTRGGARVPIAVEVNSSVLGFIPIEGEKPSRSEVASADSFLKSFMNSKIVYVGRKVNPSILSSRTILLPYHLFV